MPKTIAVCVLIVLLTILGAREYVYEAQYQWMKKGIDVQYQAWMKWEQHNKDEQKETLRLLQKTFDDENTALRISMSDLQRRLAETQASLDKKDFRVYDAKGKVQKCVQGKVYLGKDFSDTWNDITRELSK